MTEDDILNRFDKRLDKIEEKLDRLADAMAAIRLLEEKVA